MLHEAEILHTYPNAKIALFIPYHIGGCASCSYELSDTLAEVRRNYSIADPLETVLACIRRCASAEAKIHVFREQVVNAIERGEDLRLLDARSAEEWQAGRIPGTQLVTADLTFAALDSWPEQTPIVIYSNEGRRSLDKAAYFQTYGFTNARSLDGGIQAWPDKIESTMSGKAN